MGQYRAQDDERREDIVRALAERVPAFTLAQDAPIVARASRLRSGRRGYWLTWVVVVVALVALWFFLSSSLTGLVSQTVRPGKRWDAHRSLLTALVPYWRCAHSGVLATVHRQPCGALSLLIVLVSGMFWRQRRASQMRSTAVRDIVDETAAGRFSEQ